MVAETCRSVKLYASYRALLSARRRARPGRHILVSPHARKTQADAHSGATKVKQA